MDFGTCPTGWHNEGDLPNQVAVSIGSTVGKKVVCDTYHQLEVTVLVCLRTAESSATVIVTPMKMVETSWLKGSVRPRMPYITSRKETADSDTVYSS